MTKKLVEEPIFVKSQEHFEILKRDYNRNQRVILTCEKCNSTKNICLRDSVFPYVCKSCLTGKKVYNRKKAIQEHNIKFIDSTSISVECKNCRTLIDTSIRAFDSKVRKYDAFYCKSCLDIMLHEKRSQAQLKSENTMRGKHFSESILKRRNELREKTIIEKYGSVDNFRSEIGKKSSKHHSELSKDDIAEIVEKRKKTCIEKYGVDNPMKVQEIAKRMAENIDYQKRNEHTNNTLIERYGSLDNYYNNVLLEKVKEGNLKKFGVEWSFQSDQVKNSIKKTMLRKYGVDNFSKTQMFQEMLPRIMKESNKRYLYKSLYFDSSWELAYFIWLEDNNVQFIYKPDFLLYKDSTGLERRYFPDFKIGDKYVEIKGDMLFTENGELGVRAKEYDKDKFNFLKSINAEIIGSTKIRKYLTFVKEKYGKGYLRSFKQ